MRIFTYLVGREQSGDRAVRDMACNNNGYFDYIESRNIVDEITQVSLFEFECIFAPSFRFMSCYVGL